MGTAALLLALGAATLHAVWNLLLRGTRDTEAATAVSVVAFVLVLAPFAAATWDVDAAAWKYIVPSGALELVYVALLATAYRHFELSLVYPIARGLAPVATLVFAIVVVSADPSAAEIAGVFVVAAGVLLVRGARGGRGAALGLAIAAVIGGYTLDRPLRDQACGRVLIRAAGHARRGRALSAVRRACGACAPPCRRRPSRSACSRPPPTCSSCSR